MKKLAVSFFLFLASSCVFANHPLTQEESTVVQGNTAFALETYQQLKSNTDNLFFSPYSISSALAMTYAGSDGQTQKEMEKVLHFPADIKSLCEGFKGLEESFNVKNSQEPPFTLLTTANSLWIQEGLELLPPYLRLMEHCFQSQLNRVNYEKDLEKAEKAINEWVAKHTQDRIRDIIQSGDLSGLTRMVLVSTIYLKAPWRNPFVENGTKDAPFYVTAEKSTPVPMMSVQERFPYFKGNSFAMVELPYASRGEEPNLSMFILLPDNHAAMEALEKSLSPANLQQWIQSLESRSVHVQLPRFKVEDRISLKDTLEAMGMKTAFQGSANFSKMTGDKTLFISQVMHQTFLSVDEKGTEAAAATAVSMNVKAVFEPQKPVSFLADHPFLLLIMDYDSQSILFMGKINKVN